MSRGAIFFVPDISLISPRVREQITNVGGIIKDNNGCLDGSLHMLRDTPLLQEFCLDVAKWSIWSLTIGSDVPPVKLTI